MYRDRDIDRSRPLALNGRQEDGGMDLTHVVLGAMLLAEIVIAIQAATFLALRQFDEFVKSSKPSSSKPG